MPAMSFKKAALVAASLTISVNAHMFISSPVPIPGTAPKSPLDASGSNFPCHGVSLPSSGGEQMAAGSSQLLAFDTGDGANTAVHGGGSCQISITYETDAAKVKDPKNWYVIYSIEGGCPTNTYQNLDGSYQGPQGTYTGAYDCTDPRTNGVDCVNQFNFTIPKGVKSGHAIMAWSWFNTVGNRELYQNCLNTQLTGGDGSEMSEFPSMFVANMADVESCPTTESINVQFPYPGKYVTTKTPTGEAAHTASTFPLAKPTGANCANDGAPVGGAAASPSGASASPSGASSAAPGGSAPSYGSASSSQPKATGNASHGGGLVTVSTMVTVTSGAAPSSMAAGSSAAPSAPAASSAAPSYSAAPSAAPSGTGSSSGSCDTGKVSCPTVGSVICIGTTQFGLCDTDNCAVPQPLAAGTHCSGGSIMKRSHIRHTTARRHI